MYCIYYTIHSIHSIHSIHYNHVTCMYPAVSLGSKEHALIGCLTEDIVSSNSEC